MRVLWMFVFIVSTVFVAASTISQNTPDSGQGRNNLGSSETNTQKSPSYKRLILKDGSYQPISKYRIDGKLVHYFSAERHEWEEVPYSLVDWISTEKYENDTSSERLARMAKAAEDDAREQRKEEDRT